MIQIEVNEVVDMVNELGRLKSALEEIRKKAEDKTIFEIANNALKANQ